MCFRIKLFVDTYFKEINYEDQHNAHNWKIIYTNRKCIFKRGIYNIMRIVAKIIIVDNSGSKKNKRNFLEKRVDFET